jgi:ankyrin repeat protein
MYAVLSADLDICKLILEINKDNINIFDNTYCSALTLACRDNHIDIVELLLDNGSDNIINDINNVEYQENDDEWATDDEEDLADIQADEDEDEEDVEVDPVEGNNILEIEYNILDEEINYDDLDEDEEFNEICTPLMIACKRGYVELAKLLLSRGADIKIQNVYYRTALDLAIRSGHLEIVSIIQKWEFTMAMLVLQKLELYYWLDFANYIDLDNLLRSN